MPVVADLCLPLLLFSPSSTTALAFLLARAFFGASSIVFFASASVLGAAFLGAALFLEAVPAAFFAVFSAMEIKWAKVPTKGGVNGEWGIL
jgi:hypothetical protein